MTAAAALVWAAVVSWGYPIAPLGAPVGAPGVSAPAPAAVDAGPDAVPPAAPPPAAQAPVDSLQVASIRTISRRSRSWE